jgi:hypothetical protein
MEEWFRTDTALLNREFMLTKTAEELTEFYLDNYYYRDYSEPVLREILETVKGCIETLPGPEDGVSPYYDDRATLHITDTKNGMLSFGPALKFTFGRAYPAPSLLSLGGKAARIEKAFAVSANTSLALKTAAAEFIKILLTDDEVLRVTGDPIKPVNVINVVNDMDPASVRKNTGGGYIVNGVAHSKFPDGFEQKYNEDRREYFTGVDRIISRYDGREYGPAIIKWASEYYKNEMTLDECVDNIQRIR